MASRAEGKLTSLRLTRRTVLGMSVAGAALAAVEVGPALQAMLLGMGRHYPAYNAETSGGWIKDARSPVLGGNLGSCFDVCVLPVANGFQMWFSWRARGSIALVISQDGVHWSAPRIALAPADTGWESAVNRPIVLRNAGRYQMWYTGQAGNSSWIGHASSRDGLRWQRTGPKPVLSADAAWEKGSVMCPHVLWDQRQGMYRLWYSAGDQYEPNAIGYATSRDGLRWTKDPANPIFRPDARFPWEHNRVTACQVVPEDNHYLMFYIGFYDENNAQIGLARSRDGVGGWERYPGNPIIRPGMRPSEWDYSAVYKPFAVRTERGWMLWYNGRRGSVEQIGLAHHTSGSLWM